MEWNASTRVARLVRHSRYSVLPYLVNGSNVFGLILAAIGAWMVAASRGAYSWDSNTWRIGNTTDSWFAMLLGPRIWRALYLISGLVLLSAGVLFALGIV